MAIRRNIRELLEPLVGERNAYSVLWSRQLARLPVHKDIARLSKNLTIFDAYGNELFRERENDGIPGPTSFKNIITALAENLKDGKILAAVMDSAVYASRFLVAASALNANAMQCG